MIDQIPITTRQARRGLWLALCLSIIDFGLSLANFGLTSLFIGMITAFMTIVLATTQLIIIRVREKRALRAAVGTLPRQTSPTDAGLLPPTSVLGSIIVSAHFVVFFLAAAAVSIWGIVSGEVWSLVWQIVVVDTLFEFLCAGALTWLLYIGLHERRDYRELSRKIKLEDVPVDSSGVTTV
ncbi:hypothetical protein NP233_g4806 [Leucocoprinus birnbaumii]|uniref:Uncharacterized protein n=1 Tax=Leucocoprinus birnbaumii TaxID=56174 RepID=A0AAD5YWY5_9AGAR|nr:hypothetical protein NP233_g4806 [Leucocoprinus birnbaumii]